MAAAIKALNAKIRSNKYTDYFCSTRTFLHGQLRSMLGEAGFRRRWTKKQRIRKRKYKVYRLMSVQISGVRRVTLVSRSRRLRT
ncbi:uncharacterized protein K460DRAFT_366493 [Cucurbitaria berberidis CBS 394.84]|uniref:Uncharacterized protein n=1 Tax=Cucurbitaria berberidis CBS 394.84 TaxID=1168544 RepID=A0A9P4GI45_9PLEO|nr:uncharacterized protein K460DRAFT_366493 [Cucurbitaria berberidis CBS 394.84]KAF1845649.1 hypothetical protein K460DRAFT_366493 [Cucurbitaria berberidis CBS 394.84]